VEGVLIELEAYPANEPKLSAKQVKWFLKALKYLVDPCDVIPDHGPRGFEDDAYVINLALVACGRVNRHSAQLTARNA